MLPDHGEFWSQPAEWQVLDASPQQAALHFSSYGRVLPTRFEKIVTLQAGEPFVRLRYRYTNLGTAPIDFLWNIHPALAVSPDSWLDVPAAGGLTDPWRESRFPGGTRFRWPTITDRSGVQADLRRVDPPRADGADMHYLVDVREGWYAVTDRRLKTGFALWFPKEVFHHVWLFRALGGWRGLYTLILEASTGYPYDLDVARQNGTCASLPAGQTLEAEVVAIAYSGVESVSHVGPDGDVTPG